MEHVITLHGPVGSPDFSTRQVRDLPAAPVRVVIDSGGGSATSGLAVYHLLREHPHAITCEIVRAGSAAVLPALAGDSRLIHGAGYFFIHNSWATTIGTAAAMTRAARSMRELDEVYDAVVSERTGLSPRKVGELAHNETRLAAAECARLGFAHEVIGEAQASPPPVKNAMERTALSAMRVEDDSAKPMQLTLHAEALPYARLAPSPDPKLAIPQGREAAMLAAFCEGERRDKTIRQQIETRLRRCIESGGRITWPCAASWRCGACASQNYHLPRRGGFATSCATCGATSSEE